MKSRIFEIEDRDKKILRKGEITGKSMTVETFPGDYRYRIKDGETGAVISEGRVQEVLVEEESLKEPITVISQRSGVIGLYSKVWRKGYDYLEVKRADSEEQVLGEEMRAPEARIRLLPGKYKISLKNPATGLKTPPIDVNVFNETPSSYLQIIGDIAGTKIETVGMPKEEMIDEIIEGIPNGITREKARRASDLLMARRSFYGGGKPYDIKHGTELELRCEEAIRVELFRQQHKNMWIFDSIIDASPGLVRLSGREGQRYKARIFEGEDLKGECFYTVSSKYRSQLEIEAKSRESIKLKAESIEGMRNDSMAVQWNSLSSPPYRTIEPAQIEIDDAWLFVSIKEYEFLSGLAGKKYLVVQSIDEIGVNSGQARIEITSQEMQLSRCQFGIDKANYISWAEDERGKRLTRCFSWESGESEDNETIREQTILEIRSRAERYLKNKIPMIPYQVSDAFDSVLSAPEIGANDIVPEVLKRILDTHQLNKFHQQAELILDSEIEAYPLDGKLLSRNPVLDWRYGNLDFKQSESPYLVEVIKIPIEGEVSKNYIKVVLGKTIFLEPASYYIVSAISLDDYNFMQRSGYIFLSTLSKEKINFAKHMTMEVKY